MMEVKVQGVPCQVTQETNGNSINGIKQMKRRPTLDCRIALCKEVRCIISAVNKSKSHSFRIEGDPFLRLDFPDGSEAACRRLARPPSSLTRTGLCRVLGRWTSSSGPSRSDGDWRIRGLIRM
nr:PREDICTED: uncharacterized protein LOC106707078 [Latimeria chalumnae]|eukprot:XP_014354341.1 PREDICTED: uncharacterized protein LOC106707078 [Latimeria chalumnae]